MADHYPDDASDVPDEEWISEGCSNGWVLLTKDKRIRYQAAELEVLRESHLFCLVSGNMNIAEMTRPLSASSDGVSVRLGPLCSRGQRLRLRTGQTDRDQGAEPSPSRVQF
jgi:hypothetical protein